jgi:type IV pilus assembly protein PilY1
VDPVIEFYYDTNDNQTKFHRELMPANADGSPVTVFDKTKASITDHTLDELRSIWSAQKQLWDTSFPTGVASDLTSTNRVYTSDSTTGRYLFTWIDANHNGVVDANEQQPFVFSGSSGAGFYGSVSGGSKPTYSGNFRFLNTASPDVAKRIVAWVRGYDVQDVDSKGNPLWRRRLVDYNNDGTLRELRLGDIVDSTPVVAGTPSEAFDLLYGDTSYGTFRDKYRQRRQVIYVGANDGMLHAFNAGFYDARNQRIQLSPTDGTAVTQYPLGGEIWAYVPGNLLPHLRWLADPQYKHNFYVDGSPIVQDVKIFTADTTHPDGWGTVLIAPFRFGGGPISVNTNTSTTTTATPQNSFSAYVVLDVTDPEQAPKLMAEITNTELSGSTVKCGTAAGAPSCADITKVIDTYTSSVPAVAIFRDATSSSPNKFYLFTGSGTTDNGGVGTTEGGDAVATTALKVRAFDMTSLSAPAATFSMQNIGSANAGANSFAGDLIASDFNLDGRSESLYFGSTQVTSTPGLFGGALWKINFNGDPDPTNWTAQQMLSNLAAPVTIRPTVARNDRGAPMVFAGTGRAFSKNDLSSVQQQKIFGMVDTSLLASTDVQYHTLPLAMSDLVNVTGIGVNTDSTVTGDSTASTYDALVNSFNSADRLGWYLNLTAPSATTDTTPSERGQHAKPARRSIATTAFPVPTPARCGRGRCTAE